MRPPSRLYVKYAFWNEFAVPVSGLTTKYNCCFFSQISHCSVWLSMMFWNFVTSTPAMILNILKCRFDWIFFSLYHRSPRPCIQFYENQRVFFSFCATPLQWKTCNRRLNFISSRQQFFDNHKAPLNYAKQLAFVGREWTRLELFWQCHKGVINYVLIMKLVNCI